jgi:hypothetical protein
MIEAASDLSSLPEKATNLLSDWLQITIEQARELLASGDKADILDSLGKKHLITEVLIRNRKVNVLKYRQFVATLREMLAEPLTGQHQIGRRQIRIIHSAAHPLVARVRRAS